jgi:hypothetical protein
MQKNQRKKIVSRWRVNLIGACRWLTAAPIGVERRKLLAIVAHKWQ